MAYLPQNDVTIPNGTIGVADTGTTTTTGSNASAIYTGTPTTNSAFAVNALNYNSYSLQITGTWVGTLQAECSFDNGTTWYRVVPQVKGVSNSATTITANGGFVGEAAAANMIRVRATAWTSGTATISINLSPASEIVRIDNPIRLYDNANSTQATIKPASTSPAASDTSMVVTTSPNSPDVTSLSTITTNTGRIPAQGTAITSASTPVNIASDQASPLSGIASKDAYFAETYTITATGTSNTTAVDLRTRGLKYVTLHVTTVGTGTNYIFQTSSDNTNYISQNLTQPTSTVSLPVSQGNSSAQMYAGAVWARYFRIQITGQSAGTTTIYAEYSNTPIMPLSLGGQFAVNGMVSTSLSASSSGAGLTPYLNANVLATATTVATGNRRLNTLHIYNPNTSVVFLQVFNKLVANVTVGTTVPEQSWPLLPSSVLEDGLPISLQFSIGIAIAATTTATGATAPTTGLVVNFGYI